MKQPWFFAFMSVTITTSACVGLRGHSIDQSEARVRLVADELVETSDWSGYSCPQLLTQILRRTFPERDRGLLVALGPQEWGVSIPGSGGVPSGSLLFRERQYNFFADGARGDDLSFISEGQGLRPREQSLEIEGTGETISYNVAYFGPETPNDWLLSRGAHLVEMEINGGNGGLEYLLATDVQILDGTPEYPISIVGSLNSARDLFDAWSEELEPLTDEMMRGLRSDLPEGFNGRRTVREYGGVWPTWYDESSELEVVILTCPVEQTEGPEREVVPTPCAYDPVHGYAPCAYRDPEEPPRTVTQVRQYGYGMGVRYRFDRQGRLLLEERYTPRSYVPN